MVDEVNADATLRQFAEGLQYLVPQIFVCRWLTALFAPTALLPVSSAGVTIRHVLGIRHDVYSIRIRPRGIFQCPVQSLHAGHQFHSVVAAAVVVFAVVAVAAVEQNFVVLDKVGTVVVGLVVFEDLFERKNLPIVAERTMVGIVVAVCEA